MCQWLLKLAHIKCIKKEINLTSYSYVKGGFTN